MAIRWIDGDDNLSAMVIEHDGHGEETICYLSPGEAPYQEGCWLFRTDIELPEFPDTEQEYCVLSSSPKTLEEAKEWAENVMREGVRDQAGYYRTYMEALERT